MILRSKASLLCSIAVAVVFAPAWCGAQSFTISTIAGTSAGYSGDGGPATAAELNHPNRVALDTAGNLYIADSENNVIRKVSTAGTISTVAGNGTAGYTGDGGAATSAELNGPVDVAVDSAGNLYICDNGNDVIRKVAAGSGTITTYAGNSNATTYGNGGPATSAALGNPAGIAVDAAGNLYIAEPLISLVRQVTPSGTISIFAGQMSALGFSGDGGPATQAKFNNVRSVAVDSAGNVYVCDCGNGRIRKIATNGIITTVAGNGNTSTSSGDGGPAPSAGMSPEDAAADASGNLYIVDDASDVIREVSPGGTINTIAGGGSNCSAITQPALNGCLNEPYGLAVHGSNIYIADTADSLIRLLTPSGSTGGGGAAPTILSGGVVPLYSTSSTIQPGEWVSIYGNNLITGATPVNWIGNYPITLGGTSVTIDNNPAYLSYASPTLINLQAPNDNSTGIVNVTVTDANGSATATVTLAAQSPSFSLLSDARHVAGIILRSNGSGAYGNGTYDILGPTGTSLGYPTVAARAGDSVVLFGTGFGPTNPAVPAGQPYSGVATATNPVSLTINGQAVTPSFVGISEPGLFQFNLTIPSGLGTGDQPLLATLNGMSTQPNVVIALQ